MSWASDERVDSLVVFRWSDGGYVPAGRLNVEGRGVQRTSRFAYADSYIGKVQRDAKHGPLPIDPVGLPLRRGRWMPSNPEQVHLAFHDSGPDGWGKGLFDMAYPDLGIGMMEYLALGGLQRTGDLAYGPTPVRPETWRPREPLVDLPDRDDDLEALVAAAAAVDDGHPDPSHLALLVRASADIGGARPKARLRHEGIDWIAKFPTWSDTFDDPRMEAVCLDVAQAAGIDVPERRVITVRNRSVLLVRRFDRTSAGTPLGYLSAGTLLGAPSTSYATNHTYSEIAEVGRRVGAHGTAREMFKRFALNSLLRNTDDHLRNHAFLRDGSVWRLSPVFDLVPTIAGRRHVCAPATGFSPAWDPKAAFSTFAGFGLTKSEADVAHGAVAEAVADLNAFMDARRVAPADRALVLGSLGASGQH